MNMKTCNKVMGKVDEINLLYFKIQMYKIENLPVPEILQSEYLSKLDLLTEYLASIRAIEFYE